MNKGYLTCISCILALTAVDALAGESWDQWMGPQRNGLFALEKTPEQWPKNLKQAWKIKVGTGHASPLLVGDRAYVFSREDNREVMRCIDVDTREALWTQAYKAPYKIKNQAGHGHGKGPKSTPAYADGRLYAVGIGGVVTAYRAEDGKILWQKKYRDRNLAATPDFGACMSPLVWNGRMFAYLGSRQGGALIAYDLDTGDELWRKNGETPGYASPVIASFNGEPHLIAMSDKRCFGVNPDTGAELWEKKWVTRYGCNIVTPIVVGDRVILSDFDAGVRAFRVKRGDGGWTADENLWAVGDVAMFMSTGVLRGDKLFGLSHKRRGQFFKLDVKTGEIAWTGEGGGPESAGVFMTDRWGFILTTESELHVFDPAQRDLKPVASYRVADSPTWALPAFGENAILIKDKDHLALWRWR